VKGTITFTSSWIYGQSPQHFIYSQYPDIIRQVTFSVLFQLYSYIVKHGRGCLISVYFSLIGTAQGFLLIH